MSVEFGTTFSTHQCKELGFDQELTMEAFRQVQTLGFDVVRLCGQWDELEPEQDRMDFENLDWQINESLKNGTRIALTVGMKAPRFPEFHIPSWAAQENFYELHTEERQIDTDPRLREATLSFIQKTLEHVKDAENITHIQVENEPIFPVTFAGGWYISQGFVREEMALVKEIKREDQKTLLTLGVSPFPEQISQTHEREQFDFSIELADDVGLNVYNRMYAGDFTKVPFFRSRYIRPLPIYFQNKLKSWNEELKKMGKKQWIVEAQAEPWEGQRYGYLHSKKVRYPSSSPELTSELTNDLIKDGYSPILFWGSEYWFWHRRNGDNTWWNEMERYMDEIRNAP